MPAPLMAGAPLALLSLPCLGAPVGTSVGTSWIVLIAIPPVPVLVLLLLMAVSMPGVIPVTTPPGLAPAPTGIDDTDVIDDSWDIDNAYHANWKKGQLCPPAPTLVGLLFFTMRPIIQGVQAGIPEVRHDASSSCN